MRLPILSRYVREDRRNGKEAVDQAGTVVSSLIRCKCRRQADGARHVKDGTSNALASKDLRYTGYIEGRAEQPKTIPST